MPTKIVDKAALKELSNVLLALEPELPPTIWLGRNGADRELYFLYNAQPHVFFLCGDPQKPIQNIMVVPDEMMALKEGRGAAFKAFIRMYVETLQGAIEAGAEGVS